MSREIVVISLELKFNNPNIQAYVQQDVDAQIQQLTDAVQSVYQMGKAGRPNSLIIVVWREYGLDSGCRDQERRLLTLEEKNKFKEKLCSLTAQNNDLLIIAGTVLSHRLVDPKNEKDKRLIQKVEKNYQKKWRAEPQFFLPHKKSFEENKNKLCYMVRNVCYPFYQGKQLAKHDKSMVFNEVACLPRKDHPYVFRLGTPDTCDITVNNGNENLSFTVEVCCEQGNTFSLKKKPVLQFLISSSIEVHKDCISGEYTVHSDSYWRPKLITNNPSKDTPKVTLYQFNLLDKSSSLAQVEPLDIQFYEFRDKSCKQLLSHAEDILPLPISQWQEKKRLLHSMADDVFKSESYEDIIHVLEHAPPVIDALRYFGFLYKDTEKKSAARILVDDLKKEAAMCLAQQKDDPKNSDLTLRCA